MKNQSSSEKAAVGTRSCSFGAASSTVGMRSRASGVARSMKVGFSVHCSAFALHLRRYADTPIRQYVATFPHCALLAVTVIFLALTQPANAADQPATAETRLREMLRTTIMQLRAAETERAALQAAQAESAAKEKALTAQVEALTKQSAADKDAADKAITDLKAKVADQDTELTQLKDALGKWKEGYAKAADIASAKEAERAKLASQVILLDRKVADRETKNAELFRIGSEILRRYERFGIGDALAAREPFVGIARVKLENQVQDYQDKLLDQKIKPGQPPSSPPQSGQPPSSPPPGKPEQSPAPAKPEQNPAPAKPEQKTKPQSGKPNDR
jgi:hypothetical protein